MNDIIELTHISLFTGIGGIDLAAEWAGFETVLMVENNAYCQKVLRKHWPDVPILEDIFNVNKETIQEALANAFGRGKQQSEGDISKGRGRTSNGGKAGVMENTRCQYGERQLLQREYEEKNSQRATASHQRPNSSSRVDISADATKLTSVTLITGGFPCQPVSNAGKRRGKEDDRWLWPEMLRVISEVRPDWVVAENVAGLLNMGFNDCVSELESQGYETQSFLIPACAVNAPHRRDRIFIVAHSKQSGTRGECGEAGDKGRGASQEGRESLRQGDREVGTGGLASTGDDAHSTSLRRNIGSSDRGERHILSDERTTQEGEQTKKGWERGVGEISQDVADTTVKRLQGKAHESILERAGGNQLHPIKSRDNRGDWWAVEPELGRVANGISHRVDRLRCLGNAVVPQQIYPILKAIADIEQEYSI